MFNGFQKVYGLCSLVKMLAKLESVRITVKEKQYFTPVLTCSNLFKTSHTSSHLFPPVHTCSHLFILVHTCPLLFTTVHTSVTIYALRATAVSRWIFPLRKLLFLDLTCYLVEIAYFCSPNRELCNGVRLEEQYRKNVAPFGRPSYHDDLCLSRKVIFYTFEGFFSILHPTLLKLHILDRLIESFPTLYSLWSWIEIKMSIPLEPKLKDRRWKEIRVR